MYLYEEMNLSELLDDPEIDPDSADALYAIAQCYRLGKGTDVNEELYRSNLEAAAQAGSEQARQELDDSREPETAADTSSVEELPLYQQRRLAEEGDPAAILAMAQNSLAMNDSESALSYLQRAEKNVGQSVYTAEQEQRIFLQLGELFSKAPLENPKESARYYGLASELGSAEAALVLARYARTGYGCAANAAQADTWVKRAAENGDESVKYELALELLESKPVYACSLLDEVIHSAEDMFLRVRAQIVLDSRESGKIPAEDVEDAWIVRGAPEIARLLLALYQFPPATSTPPVPEGMTLHTFRVYQDAINLLLDDDADNYGTVNGLPVTSDRAEWLFCNCTSYTRRRLWAECAALMGNEHAASWIESDDLCEKGIALLSQAPDQAVPFLRQAAERGSSKAAYYLGLCLHHGDGVQANPSEAARWLRTSAENGYIEAMYSYANLCLEGTADSNPEKRRWLEKAASCDFAQALFDLCSSKNPGDSLQHLGRLAASGNVSSQYLLARCYLEERGAKKDVVNGIKWYQAAARTRPDGEYDLKRNAIVQYAYAAANIADYMLVRDDRDPAQTFYWAQEAYNAHQAAISEMGGPASICFASILGNCYLFGIGTPVDYDRAIEYYRSADARYEFAAPAWAGLGRCSLYGLGMPKNLAQARRYFEQAKQGGYTVSQQLLNDLSAAENELNRQQAEQENLRAEQARQASFDGDFARCARYLLGIILTTVLVQVFRTVHVPLIGNIVIALLSIAQLVLVLVLIVKGFTLYQNTSNSGFGSRFGQAFVSECKAFGHAITSLFTGGSSRRSNR